MAVTIEPTEFDLVVVGTGLQESLIAGAAAKAGKAVLHLDASPVYGDLWGGLSLKEYCEWPEEHKKSWKSEESGSRDVSSSDGVGEIEEPVHGGIDVYRHFVVLSSPGFDLEERGYVLDFAPKLTYCSGALVHMLVAAGAHQYVDYRLIDESYIWYGEGFQKVPASRSDVFTDRMLSASEKRVLTMFLKNVVSEIEKRAFGMESNLSGSFKEWLEKEGLCQRTQNIIYHSVAMRDVGEEVSAEEGFELLSLYLKSIGRYRPDSSPFMVPHFSCSDIPQAFCRTCAIHEGIYVLRCGISSVLIDQSTSQCTGVITNSGQKISCKSLILPPHVEIKRQMGSEDLKPKSWISRGVCIVDRPLQDSKRQIFAVLPPGSVDDRLACVHVLQVGPPSCPDGRFLVYLSTSSTGKTAQDDLWPAVQTLMNTKLLESEQDESVRDERESENSKPNLLWASFHNQRRGISPDRPPVGQNVVTCGFPDEMVGYTSTIDEARDAFAALFPDLTMMGSEEVEQQQDVGDSDDDAFDDLEKELSDLGVN